MTNNDRQYRQKFDAVARRFLRSEKMRTYTGWDGESYVLDFERCEDDPTFLECTTWGYDYAGLTIPNDYGQMVNFRMRAMLNIGFMIPSEISFRLYDEMFRAVNP